MIALVILGICKIFNHSYSYTPSSSSDYSYSSSNDSENSSEEEDEPSNNNKPIKVENSTDKKSNPTLSKASIAFGLSVSLGFIMIIFPESALLSITACSKYLSAHVGKL